MKPRDRKLHSMATLSDGILRPLVKKDDYDVGDVNYGVTPSSSRSEVYM